MEDSILKKPASDVEIEAQEELNAHQFVESRYNFLNGHKGVRPNSLHGLMANTGIGKSSLTKTVIVENARVIKTLIWLSEEKIVEYQMLISKLDKSVLSNITFVQERDIPEKYKQTSELFFRKFIDIVMESGCGFVFIDNITTSPFYSSRFGPVGQTKTTTFLLSFVKQYCSIFYVSHTASNISDNLNRMLKPEDIRGAKDLPMQTEFLYGMQRFTSGDNKYNVLSVLKARGYDSAPGTYALVYTKGSYVGDGKISFEGVNTLFQNRDFLGKRMLKAKEPPKKPAAEVPLYANQRGLDI